MATDTTDPEQPRRELYRVIDDDGLSLREKQERVLAIGREYLGVENGHIERVVDDETHEVVASVGDQEIMPAGARLDRATTFCRRTLQQDSALAVSNAPEQGYGDDPARLEHGLDCYFGATIFVDDEPWGTVCFVSRDAHAAFAPTERAFVELTARTLGRELENSKYRRALDEKERARERSEDKYEALIEMAPDAIFLADADTGEIVDANQKAAELTGYAESELQGRSVLDLHPVTDREQYRDLLESGMETTQDRFDDGRQLYVRRADGSGVPVEMSVRTVELDGQVFMQGIVRDVSDRRERERELRVKDRAIEETGVGVTIADATEPDFPLVYANRGFEELTGYARSEAMDRNCRFLQGPRTDSETTDAIRAALEAGEPISTEILNYRADGTPFWNGLTLTPVTDDRGELSHYIGIQQDRTPQKRRRQLIGVLNRILRHNLRNDMNVVLSYAELLEEEYDLGEGADHLKRIRDTARGLVTQSEKVRTLEAGVREDRKARPLDAAEVVETVGRQLTEEFPGASVTVEAPDEQTVLATGELHDVLYELGENAIVHDDGDPDVTLAAGPDDDGRVSIRVADTGPGLPGNERRVLESGQETVLDHGSGVGLWLVRWFVTEFGGDVSVAVDDGTTVALDLPTPQADDAGVGRRRRSVVSSE